MTRKPLLITFAIVAAIATALMATGAMAQAEGTGDLKTRFTYLSAHGNSNCSDLQAYGGLAKLLIRDHGFNGPQVTEVGTSRTVAGATGEVARRRSPAFSDRSRTADPIVRLGALHPPV